MVSTGHDPDREKSTVARQASGQGLLWLFQQFSFPDSTDSPNTQDRLFGPYVVHPVDSSQSFEEMAQKLPLMVSIGKEFQGGLSCYTLAGGIDGFADWHSR